MAKIKPKPTTWAAATDWDGESPSLQPLLPGMQLYRAVWSVTSGASLFYLFLRFYSVYEYGTHWSAWVGVWVEFCMASMLFLKVKSRWVARDTHHTTPSLKDLSGLMSSNAMPCVPRVAILIPTLNEDVEELEGTIRGALELEWPSDQLAIYVCDDGKRDWVKALVKRLSLEYLPKCICVQRIKRSNYPHHAKAGNLNATLGFDRNFALANDMEGIAGTCDYVAVFDADMTPEPTFLQRTLPFFFTKTTQGWRRNKIGFVQTPQRFVNIPSGDPLDQSQLEWYQFGIAAHDSLGASIFVGSGAIFDINALQQIGGFQYGSLLEDVHTAVVLNMFHGWKGRYLNESLQHGYAPPTLRDSFNQRCRWMTGGVQLWRCRFSTLAFWRSPHMSFQAKIAYAQHFGGIMGPSHLVMDMLIIFWPLVCYHPIGSHLYPVPPSSTEESFDLAYCTTYAIGALCISIFGAFIALLSTPNLMKWISDHLALHHMDVLKISLLSFIGSRTYMFVRIRAVFDAYFGSNVWLMGAKRSSDNGVWHPLVLGSILLIVYQCSFLGLLVYQIITPKEDWPIILPLHGMIRLKLTALFTFWCLLTSYGVMSAFWVPLPKRKLHAFTEVAEPVRSRYVNDSLSTSGTDSCSDSSLSLESLPFIISVPVVRHRNRESSRLAVPMGDSRRLTLSAQ